MLDKKDIEIKIDKYIYDLIDLALENRASDIHIEAFKTYAKIRLRIDGKLREIERLELKSYEKLVTKIKLISMMDISEKRRPQDGNLNLKGFDDIDFRVSSLSTINGEKIVIRILSLAEFEKNANLLGFSEKSLRQIANTLLLNSGLIIFSGPTGSGKSTSLYSILNKLNTGDNNILTVEDPVEYKIEGINQISVNEKIDLSFAKILRSILRQDPDIIMIGEIRDSETAKIAIRAAITGHLVLTTLHTKDALSSVIRLKDLGVDDYLIAQATNLLASQRLVRKLCECKKEDRLTDTEFNLLSKFEKINRDMTIYRPCGCEKCNEGYRGRRVIEEVFEVDSTMKDLFKDINKNNQKIKEKLEKDNFIPMTKLAIDLIKKGETSVSEILSVLDV